jgi:hypothetical protein
VERINNLVGKAYKTIDAVDGIVEFVVQAIDAQRKTRAVTSGYHFAGSGRNFVE